MVLELLLPKPGGHVLSPDFGQIRRRAVMEMGLRGYAYKVFLNRPRARVWARLSVYLYIIVDYVSV